MRAVWTGQSQSCCRDTLYADVVYRGYVQVHHLVTHPTRRIAGRVVAQGLELVHELAGGESVRRGLVGRGSAAV